MRTLALTQNMTVDCAVEMLDDWFDPSDESEDVVQELRRQDATSDAILLGRQTFEDFRGYWPQQRDDATGVADHLNRTEKYVVSSTLTDAAWENSTILTGGPVEEVGRLKREPGQDIVCTGSIGLSHALLSAGLVDEFRMFTFPYVQGRGRRYFPKGYIVPRLRLLDHKRFGNGVTYTAYAPS